MESTNSIGGCNIAVIFFAFNRADKLSNTINSYLLCNNVQKKDVYVYIDGPRCELDLKDISNCNLVASNLLPDAKIVVRKVNFGLKKSIFEGISEVINEYDAAIIIEDDLQLNPEFYNFMKTGLTKYNNSNEVYQISGYNYNPTNSNNAFFLPITTSWGWATWRNKWNKFSLEENHSFLIDTYEKKCNYNLAGSFNFSRLLDLEMKGKISSWAIRWYSYVYKNKGLTLYPPRSLVYNDGFNESGTHSAHTANALFNKHEFNTPINKIIYPEKLTYSGLERERLIRVFKYSFIKKIMTFIKSKLKRFFYA